MPKKKKLEMEFIYKESDEPAEVKQAGIDRAFDIIIRETILGIMLKSVFGLMFEKLKSISVGDNFIDEIKRLKAPRFDKSKPDAYFFEHLVPYIIAEGSGDVAIGAGTDSIKKALSDYDIGIVSKYADADREKIMIESGPVMSRDKLEACVKSAKTMKSISKDYGSFGKYLEANDERAEGLKWKLMDRFSGIGDIPALDYLKELGIDAVKPDVHVLRMMHRLGLLYSEDASPDNIKKTLENIDKASRSTNEKMDVITAVLQMYGGGGSGVVLKAICSKDKPLCDECPIAGYCKAGFLNAERRNEIAHCYGPHTILDAPMD